MSDPLSYLRSVKPHECDGACRKHNAGIAMDEVAGRVKPLATPKDFGQAQAPDAPQTDPEDAPCEDCGLTLREHEGVTSFGDRSCAWTSCKKWVPMGPKE